MLKQCLNCKKEYEAKRKTAKYCSDNCRKLAFLKEDDSVPKISVPEEISVPNNSVPVSVLKVSLQEESIVTEPQHKPFSKKVGECHGCGKPVSELRCICYECQHIKGITHKSLGVEQSGICLEV